MNIYEVEVEVIFTYIVEAESGEDAIISVRSPEHREPVSAEIVSIAAEEIVDNSNWEK